MQPFWIVRSEESKNETRNVAGSPSGETNCALWPTSKGVGSAMFTKERLTLRGSNSLCMVLFLRRFLQEWLVLALLLEKPRCTWVTSRSQYCHAGHSRERMFPPRIPLSRLTPRGFMFHVCGSWKSLCRSLRFFHSLKWRDSFSFSTPIFFVWHTKSDPRMPKTL